MRKIIFSLLFVLISTVSFAGGNSKTTILNGKVIDDEGNPVVGAKVVLVDSKKEVYTDFDGVFQFKNVTTETSTVKVSYLSHEDLIAKVPNQVAKESSIELQIQSK